MEFINRTAIRLHKINKKYYLRTSYFLSLLIAILVYITGGTAKVYANFMYISIAVCSSTNGKTKGVFHALFSSLLIGPLMPLDVSLNINQDPANWMLRSLIYLIVSLVIGYHSDLSKKHFEKTLKQNADLIQSNMATIYALVKLTEFRDDETGLHIERVADSCRYLAKKLQAHPKFQRYIDDSYINTIHKASPLHDIGKVCIPDSILLKPERLTSSEFEIMKTHTTLGAKALFDLQDKFPNNILFDMGINIVLYHHEKWDGAGYPHGLIGDEIPLSAQIMAIVDVYDALRSERIYKKAYPHSKAMRIIAQESEGHFNPDISKTFLDNEAEFERIFNHYSLDKSIKICVSGGDIM